MTDLTGMTAPGLTRGQIAACLGSLLAGTALAAYGAVGSYQTLAAVAAAKHLPLPHLVPLGLDGGLFGIVIVDLVLTWTSQPIGWLRQLARLLAAGTVTANAAAGWPDPVAVGLHGAAPLMLLAMIEALRIVLLRRIGARNGTLRDRIPVARWLLSPWRTWLLWRRMVLWQMTDYRLALDNEARIRHVITMLRARHGRGWKKKVPVQWVWLLDTGTNPEELSTLVHQLVSRSDDEAAVVSPPDSAMSATTPSMAQFPAASPTTANTIQRRSEDPGVLAGDDESAVSGHAQLDGLSTVDDALLRQAVSVNRQHWRVRGRTASADTLRRHLQIGSATARSLARTIKERDRATVCSRADTALSEVEPK